MKKLVEPHLVHVCGNQMMMFLAVKVLTVEVMSIHLLLIILLVSTKGVCKAWYCVLYKVRKVHFTCQKYSESFLLFVWGILSVLLHLNAGTVRKYLFLKKITISSGNCFCENFYVRVRFRGKSMFVLYHWHLVSMTCFKYIGECLPFWMMIWEKGEYWQ